MSIADGAQASPGDLIICTRNDHTTEAGEPRRTLANGDLLRIEAITRRRPLVRRALDADPRTGQRRWTDRHFLLNFYQDAELGYAVTDHAAQGRTVHTGLAVITGTEDRQHAYVALTRGTDANHAYVFTVSPKRADPAPAPARHPNWPGTTRSCRTGGPSRLGHPACHRGHDAGRAVRRPGTRRPAALRHPGPPPGPRRRRPPGPVHAIWTTETSPAREQRYRDLLAAALPPEYLAARTPDRWLWRTLRAAELAGLDPAQVLAEAVAERDLAGARDIPAVIDTRIRHRTGPSSRCHPGRGPRKSQRSPTPNAALTSPRSRR